MYSNTHVCECVPSGCGCVCVCMCIMYSCVCAKKAERETDIPTAGICRQSSLVMARKVFPSVYTLTWNKLHQVNWMFAPMLIMRNKLISNINISCIDKKTKPCMHVTQKGNKLGRGYWLFSSFFLSWKDNKKKMSRHINDSTDKASVLLNDYLFPQT